MRVKPTIDKTMEESVVTKHEVILGPDQHENVLGNSNR